MRLLVAVLLVFSAVFAVGNGATGNCNIRADWHGSWFHKDYPHPFNLNSTDFGVFSCVEAQGDRYVVLDRTYSCYKCVVIHERHRNVLQYKESAYCVPQREPLQQICMDIAGDAELHSLFRRGPNVASINCPFEGPFTFSYDKGGGNCSDPVSRVDTCTMQNRLLFRFQACHNVRASESSEEELECLASWRDGSKRYLVGKMYTRLGNNAHQQGHYRCFVYEKEKNGRVYHVAESGDESCAGVFSATEGARTLRLQKVNHNRKACSFPKFVTTHRKWHTLDGETTFHFPRGNGTLKISGEWTTSRDPRVQNQMGGQFGPGSVVPAVIMTSSSSSWILDGGGGGLTLPSSSRLHEKSDEKVTCVEEKAQLGPDSALILAYSVRGCDSGYVCMRFHQRDEHVIELQTGERASSPDYACNEELFFSESRRKTTTLVTSSPRELACPMVGRYVVDSEEWRQKSPTSNNNIRANSGSSFSSNNYGGFNSAPNFNEEIGGDFGFDDTSNEAGWRRRRHRGDGATAGRTARQLVGAKGCPDDGAAPVGFSTLHVGCRDNRRMELGAKCRNSGDVTTEYRCHGNWEDNGTRFLIVSPTHDEKTFYCVTSRYVSPTTITTNNNNNNMDPSLTPPVAAPSSSIFSLDDDAMVASSSPPGVINPGPILISYFRTSCSSRPIDDADPYSVAARRSMAGFDGGNSFAAGSQQQDLVSFNVTLTGQCAQPLSSATTTSSSATFGQPSLSLVFLNAMAMAVAMLAKQLVPHLHER